MKRALQMQNDLRLVVVCLFAVTGLQKMYIYFLWKYAEQNINEQTLFITESLIFDTHTQINTSEYRDFTS